MNYKVALVMFLKIFSSSALKTTCILKLESLKPTYINNKFVDYDINAARYNKTINVFNQTLKFKFDVTGSALLCDGSAYRITNSNHTFLMSHVAFPFKQTIAMEQFDIGSMWTEYTRPPLLWPPKINVTYRTYGWAPDARRFPAAIPAGNVKILTMVSFPNRTKIYGNQWIISINYK